jgi:hypothetical protein
VVRREDHRLICHLGPGTGIKRGEEAQATGHPSLHPSEGGSLGRVR